MAKRDNGPVFAKHRCPKRVSPEACPIGVAAKRRKWPAISNPERLNQRSWQIRHLGGGEGGIRTLGPPQGGQRFSRPPRSTAPAPLRAAIYGAGLPPPRSREGADPNRS